MAILLSRTLIVPIYFLHSIIDRFLFSDFCYVFCNVRNILSVDSSKCDALRHMKNEVISYSISEKSKQKSTAMSDARSGDLFWFITD